MTAPPTRRATHWGAFAGKFRLSRPRRPSPEALYLIPRSFEAYGARCLHILGRCCAVSTLACKPLGRSKFFRFKGLLGCHLHVSKSASPARWIKSVLAA